MTARGPFDLTGKVALVTGANSGIGLGFATGIAKAGGDVVIWGRRSEQNALAADRLRAHGGRVLAQQVDVADEARVVEAFSEAVEEMGRVDCVIANAGVNSWPSSFTELSSEDYHGLLAINQHGAFYTLREAVRHMTARAERGDPGGSLIVCGSLSAIAGLPRIEHYSAAKGALMAMTRSIAAEFGRHGIRANMVLPGRIATGLAGSTGTRKDDAPYRVIPIPRSGTPEDLEGIAVYLMSDASRYHTGDTLVIDGGLSITLPAAKT